MAISETLKKPEYLLIEKYGKIELENSQVIIETFIVDEIYIIGYSNHSTLGTMSGIAFGRQKYNYNPNLAISP